MGTWAEAVSSQQQPRNSTSESEDITVKDGEEFSSEYSNHSGEELETFTEDEPFQLTSNKEGSPPVKANTTNNCDNSNPVVIEENVDKEAKTENEEEMDEP